MQSHSLAIYEPPPGPLNVHYADEAILIVEKPAGLLTVPGRGEHLSDCLESRVKLEFPEAKLVHRLDMQTSGLVVFAQSAKAQKHLGLQFEKRRVKKRYQALVSGSLVDSCGMVDLPLICDWPNRPRQKVCYTHGKPAQTAYHCLDSRVEASRVDLFPVTGRSHQLRVHMASLGHPIIGDPFYGTDTARRMMLHAAELSVRHPESKEDLTFVSEVPF